MLVALLARPGPKPFDTQRLSRTCPHTRHIHISAMCSHTHSELPPQLPLLVINYHAKIHRHSTHTGHTFLSLLKARPLDTYPTPSKHIRILTAQRTHPTSLVPIDQGHSFIHSFMCSFHQHTLGTRYMLSFISEQHRCPCPQWSRFLMGEVRKAPRSSPGRGLKSIKH